MRLFVYGSWRLGLGEHYALEGAKLIGDAETYAQFKMWDMGGYPAVTTAGSIYPFMNSSIKGELWEISEEKLNALDELNGEDPFIYRHEVQLRGHEKAWMYLYALPESEVGRDEVESGDWLEWVSMKKPHLVV